jgi:ABC-2 type transport system ATP-binding protein
VLSDISLNLKEGEIFGLVGLNGIGKTTLIKIILDLLDADSGYCRIFDQPTGRPESRKNLGYLPEKFQPSRYLKGHEYLQLSHATYKRDYHPERGNEMAEALALDAQALNQRVGTYSKGMGQKLGLACALMIDTPLLILDEPMSGLDPQARIMLKRQLKLAREAGRTLFFSSHILADIDEICDRIAILHNGEFQYVGRPEEFKNQYPRVSLEEAFLKAIKAPVAA